MQFDYSKFSDELTVIQTSLSLWIMFMAMIISTVSSTSHAIMNYLRLLHIGLNIKFKAYIFFPGILNLLVVLEFPNITKFQRIQTALQLFRLATIPAILLSCLSSNVLMSLQCLSYILELYTQSWFVDPMMSFPYWTIITIQSIYTFSSFPPHLFTMGLVSVWSMLPSSVTCSTTILLPTSLTSWNQLLPPSLNITPLLFIFLSLNITPFSNYNTH